MPLYSIIIWLDITCQLKLFSKKSKFCDQIWFYYMTGIFHVRNTVLAASCTCIIIWTLAMRLAWVDDRSKLSQFVLQKCQIIRVHYKIKNHDEKCIRISTNMPGIGLIITMKFGEKQIWWNGFCIIKKWPRAITVIAQGSAADADEQTTSFQKKINISIAFHY